MAARASAAAAALSRTSASRTSASRTTAALLIACSAAIVLFVLGVYALVYRLLRTLRRRRRRRARRPLPSAAAAAADGAAAREAFAVMASCKDASIPSNVIQRYKGSTYQGGEAARDAADELDMLDDAATVMSVHTDEDRRFATCGRGPRVHRLRTRRRLRLPLTKDAMGERVWVSVGGESGSERWAVGFIREIDREGQRVRVRFDRRRSIMEALACLQRTGDVRLEHEAWSRGVHRVERVSVEAHSITVKSEPDMLQYSGRRVARLADVRALVAEYADHEEEDAVDGEGAPDDPDLQLEQRLQVGQFVAYLEDAEAARRAAVRNERMNAPDQGVDRLKDELHEVLRDAMRRDPTLTPAAVFQRFDRSGDGLLSVDELMEALKYLGFHMVDDTRASALLDDTTQGYVVLDGVINSDLAGGGGGADGAMMTLRLRKADGGDAAKELADVQVVYAPIPSVAAAAERPCVYDTSLEDTSRWVAYALVRRTPPPRLVEECFARASADALENERLKGDAVGRVLLESTRLPHTFECKYVGEGDTCDTRDALVVYHTPTGQWHRFDREIDGSWARAIVDALERGEKTVRGDGYTLSGGGGRDGNSFHVVFDRARGSAQQPAGRPTTRRYEGNTPYKVMFDARTIGANSRYNYVYEVDEQQARSMRVSEFLEDRCVDRDAKKPSTEFTTECEEQEAQAEADAGYAGADGDCGYCDMRYRDQPTLRYYCKHPDALKGQFRYPPRPVSLWPEVPCPKKEPKTRCTVPYGASDYQAAQCPAIRDEDECMALYPNCEWKRRSIVPVAPARDGSAFGMGARVRSNYKGEDTMFPARIVGQHRGRGRFANDTTYDLKYDDDALGTETQVGIDRCVYKSDCGGDLLTPKGYQRIFGEPGRAEEPPSRAFGALHAQGDLQRATRVETVGDRFVAPWTDGLSLPLTNAVPSEEDAKGSAAAGTSFMHPVNKLPS